MIYLGLKGYGDLAILLAHIVRIESRSTLIVRADLYDFAVNILGNRHEIIKLRHVAKVFPLYFIKKISLRNIVIMAKGYFEIKKIVNSKRQVIVLDIKSWRNIFFFLFLPRLFLPKAETIYESYEKFLGFKLNAHMPDGNCKKYVIFPQGSLPSKQASLATIKNALNKSGISSYDVVIGLYRDDGIVLSDYDEFNKWIFESVSELIDGIKGFDAVISVDTFQLHLAILLNKPVIPIGIINEYFKLPFEVK